MESNANITMAHAGDRASLPDTTSSPAHVSPRIVVAGAVGSVVEYFDFGVYGYVATILATQFFGKGDPTSALLNTLAAFAVAFVLRPLGGILFSHFGDRYGRKNTLGMTVLLMSAASGLIGILPTYAAIGVGASALLVLARCLQGLAAGGELGGAIAFVAEHSPAAKRGLLCSTTQTGALGGVLLASLAVALLNQVLSHEQMNSWGWRIPFLIAIPIGVIGLWIRTRLSEARSFQALAESDHVESAPVLELLRSYRVPLLQSIGLSILLFSAYYITYVYVNIHLQRVVGVSASLAFWSTTLTLSISVLFMPAFGALSDRIGRKPMFIAGSLAALVLAVPCFTLMNAGGATAVCMQMVLGLIESALMGVAFSTLAELYPTRVRYTGIALGFNVGGVVTGGSAPFFCTWLVSATGSSIAPAYFLGATAIITLFSALTLKETAGSVLRA
ncbi:L-Proline/Glycine betaine transporter ProP [Caballeronia glathei]|nr:L-Proline/Glycine betaine transporter ProP [Caballeronia glathei]